MGDCPHPAATREPQAASEFGTRPCKQRTLLLILEGSLYTNLSLQAAQYLAAWPQAVWISLKEKSEVCSRLS